MERNVAELREQVALLERRVEKFKERVAHLRWQTAMLVRAKASHPRYPVWEWEYHNIHSILVQRYIFRVESALTTRLLGVWEFDEFSKDVPGIASDQLYQSRPPTLDEVYSFFKIAGGFTSNAKVTEMFVVQRMNQRRSPLIDFVLDGKVGPPESYHWPVVAAG
jgi:hypothetical protein